MIEDFWANALYSVTPTIALGFLFWFIMRAIIRADRTERSVHAKIEAEERAKFAASTSGVIGAAGVAGVADKP